MEKLMNEENEWDHKLSAEVKEGPADCIRMDEVRAALKGMKSRDVKTVYFSEPVTGLPKPVFYRLPVTERPIVSVIIVNGRSALAISLSVDHLLLHGGRGPHTRHTGRRRSGAKDSGVSKR